MVVYHARSKFPQNMYPGKTVGFTVVRRCTVLSYGVRRFVCGGQSTGQSIGRELQTTSKFRKGRDSLHIRHCRDVVREIFRVGIRSICAASRSPFVFWLVLASFGANILLTYEVGAWCKGRRWVKG